MTVDVAARTLLVAFAIGCEAEAPPAIVDTDRAPAVDAQHTGATAPLPTAQLDPPSPNWADAIRCISPDLGDARLVDVRFWVNGVAIRADSLQPPTGNPSKRALPADASLGMDTIRCALRVEHPVAGDVWLESTPATVEPPLPAVRIPPGAFLWQPRVVDVQAPSEARITYPFAIGTTEVSEAVFEGLVGYVLPDHARWADELGPDHPVIMANWHEVAAFSVVLSTLDGHDGCFSCDGGDKENVRCSPVDDFLACSGWRLPTTAEWLYAAESANQADDSIPVVGRVVPDDLTWWQHADGDIDVVSGPYAGTKLGAQCWWAGARATSSSPPLLPVGTTLPNTYGIHDLCGNASEWTADATVKVIGGMDPHSVLADADRRSVIGPSSSSDPFALRRWNLGAIEPTARGTFSVRITRTLPREDPTP